MVLTVSFRNESRRREIAVDSGASMHMMSKKELTSKELRTVPVCRRPTTVITANGRIETNEAATVYVKDMGMFVTLQLFDDTIIGEEAGYSYEWKEGETPNRLKNGS